MRSGATNDALMQLIAPTIDAMGYDVVRVKLSGSSPARLQVMAERRDLIPMTVEDCAALSTAVSAVLDVEDPIPGHYDLEVSSPGIDRPLVRPADFERYTGFVAKLETAVPIDGRKRFRGRLVDVTDDVVQVELDTTEQTVAIPFEALREAKLVLTDDLIAASLNNDGGE
jgi:ribosome maturation factor RimP